MDNKTLMNKLKDYETFLTLEISEREKFFPNLDIPGMKTSETQCYEEANKKIDNNNLEKTTLKQTLDKLYELFPNLESYKK